MKPLTFNVDTENKNRQPFVGNAASLMTAMMKPQHQHPPQQQQQHMTTMYPYRTSANTAGLVMGLDSREPLERQVEPSTTMMMMNHTTSQNHSALSNKIMTTVMKPTTSSATAVVVDPSTTTRKIRHLETKWHEAQAQCGRLETELATLRHTCTATQQTLEAQLAERDALITKLEADLQQAQQDALPRKRDERDARRKEAALAARVAELERELAAALEEQQTKNPPPPASGMERRARRSSNDRPVNYNESEGAAVDTGSGTPISPDYEYEEMSVPPRGGAASGSSSSGALTNVPRRRSSAMKQPTLSALSTMNANEKVFLAIPEYEGRINERYYVTGLHYWVFKAPDDTQRRAMVCCHCGSTKSFATAELFAKSMSHLTLHLIRNCPNIPKADIDQIPGKAATRPLMDMPMYAKRVWKQNVPTWNVLGMEPNKRGGFSGMGAQMSDDASSSPLDNSMTTTKLATTTRRASLPLANTTNHNHHPHHKKVLQVSTTVESAADMLCLLASGQTMRETTKSSSNNKKTHSSSQAKVPESHDDEDDDDVRHVLLAQPEHKGILSPRYFLTGMHFYVYTSPEDSRRRVMKCRHCAFTASYASVDIMTLSMAHLPRHLMRTCQGISLEEKQRIEQCTPGARGTIAMKTYVEQIWKRKVPVLDVTELQQYALQHDQPDLAENNEPDSSFAADDVVEAAAPRVKDAERKLADKVPSAAPVERSISKEVAAGKAKATPLTHSAMAGPSELLQASLDNLDQQVLLSLPENEGVIRSRYYLTGLHFWVLTPRGEPARRIMLCRWCGATKSFASVDQLHKSIAHLSLHLLRHCPHCPDESKNQIAACPQREDAQMDLPTFAKQVWKREVPLCDMPRSGTGMLTSGGGKPKSWQQQQQQQKATTTTVTVEAARSRPKRGAKHLGSGDNDDASKRPRVDVACEDNATILKRLGAMPNAAPLKYPVGTTFTKHFPGIGSYSGKVVGHDGIFYLIEYADKDEEDMSEQELDALITAVPTTLPSNMIQEDAGGSMNNAENKALRSPAAAAAARKPLPSVF